MENRLGLVQNTPGIMSMDNFDIPLEPQDPKPGSRAHFSGCYIWSNTSKWDAQTYLGITVDMVALPFTPASYQEDFSWSATYHAGAEKNFQDFHGMSEEKYTELVYEGFDPESRPVNQSILGNGDYPDAHAADAILYPLSGGIMGLAIDKGTTIRFYKEKNFKGGVVLELTGPKILNFNDVFNMSAYEESHMHTWNPEAVLADGTKIGDTFSLDDYIHMSEGFDTVTHGVEPGSWADKLGYYRTGNATLNPEREYLKNGVSITTFVNITQGSFKIRDSSVLDIPTPEPDTSQECSTKLTVSFDNVDHWTYKIADRSEVIVGSGNTANVSGLSPGTYNVQVRGLDSEGNEVARDNIITNVPGTYTANSTTDDPWTIERPVNVGNWTTFGFNDFHAKQRRVGNQEVWDWTQPGPPPPTPAPAPTSTPVPTATPMPTPTPLPVPDRPDIITLVVEAGPNDVVGRLFGAETFFQSSTNDTNTSNSNGEYVSAKITQDGVNYTTEITSIVGDWDFVMTRVDARTSGHYIMQQAGRHFMHYDASWIGTLLTYSQAADVTGTLSRGDTISYQSIAKSHTSSKGGSFVGSAEKERVKTAIQKGSGGYNEWVYPFTTIPGVDPIIIRPHGTNGKTGGKSITWHSSLHVKTGGSPGGNALFCFTFTAK